MSLSVEHIDHRLPDVRGSSSVTVVIPSWNGVELLDRVSLPSLARQYFRDFAVIVVDNGSSDGSVELLQSKWPTVHLIALTRNHGFAYAVNCGIRNSTSEFIALLNNDVALDPHWLEELINAARVHTDAAGVAGKLFSYENRTQIQSVGETVTWDGMPMSHGSGERDCGQHDCPRAVMSVTAGAALYRRSAFQRVGLFDEDFVTYHEDMDWGLRAQLAGMQFWYIPTATAYHIGQATSSRIAPESAYYDIRNRIWLVLKNFPSSILVRRFPRITLAIALRSGRTARRGLVVPVIRAWIHAGISFPGILEKRHTIQSTRRVDVAYLSTLLGPANLRSMKLSRAAELVAWTQGVRKRQ